MPQSPRTDADRLRHRVLPGGTGLGVGAGLWHSVEVVASTGSTNADLAARMRAGDGAGLVLVADHQSAGRGRFARRWEAPPGAAVAVSLGVAPRRPLPEWMWLSLLTGVAVARGIHRASGVDATLKWPNDVLIEGRKICGILSERVDGPYGPGCVVGFGINVALTAEELPVPTATSLLLCGAEVDRADLVVEVLAEWSRMYRLWDDGRLALLQQTYEEQCSTIGRDVRVLLGAPGGTERTVLGRAVGIDPSGAVLVRTDDGVEAYAAGDVTHLR